MDPLTQTLSTAPPRDVDRVRAEWLSYLAVALCYAGALWIAIRDSLSAQPAGWLAQALDTPGFVLALALAAALWFAAGLTYKGWAHAIAALVFAMPRIYSLPTDLFGAAPAVALNIAAGVYLHVALRRDRALLRANNRALVFWLLGALGCLLLRLAVTQAFAALKESFQLLGK